MRNTRHAIKRLAILLQNAMPMDCGTLIRDVVSDVDLDRVSPVRLYLGAWVLPIN